MAEHADSPNAETATGNGDADIVSLGPGDSGNGSLKGFIDPASAASGRSGDSAGTSGPRKRGRPAGSKNASKAQKTGKIDLGPFSGCILGIHTMLASISRTPELELDEAESEKLAKASSNVLRHYVDLDVSQKAADWTNLFMALGAIYGPRVFAHKMRKAKEREARQTRQPPTVENPPQAKPQPAGNGAPNVGANVIQMPGFHTSGLDVPGANGPGVG